MNAVLSSLALIKTITGGPLAGIPLWMVLSPKTVTVPSSGQNMVVFVVSLEYRGPEQELAELGYAIARRRIEHRVKLEQIEEDARRMLVPPHAEPMEEQAETGAEFFPDVAREEVLAVVEEQVIEPPSSVTDAPKEQEVGPEATDDSLPAVPSSRGKKHLKPAASIEDTPNPIQNPFPPPDRPSTGITEGRFGGGLFLT